MIHFTSKNTQKTYFLAIITSFLTIFAIFSNTACSKSSSAPESEQMISYAKSNNITYVSDPSGILYEIITPGNNTHPTINNTITVTYVGTLMNGKQFDAGTITYALSNLIPGWQIAVPKIGIGGEIKVLIPSSLGYGSSGSGSIPGNSPLYFDIKLSAVK
jgi:FKBP-type peptidyl-prolyl cis-trans isomerase FkpA